MVHVVTSNTHRLFIFWFTEDGGITILKQLKYVCLLYLLPHPELKNLIFLIWYLRGQSCVGLIFLDKPYAQIVVEYLKIECSWYTESIQLKFPFLQTSFMWVKPWINSERSRCFLVVLSASLEKRTLKQSRRSSMIRFSYINSQFWVNVLNRIIFRKQGNGFITKEINSCCISLGRPKRWLFQRKLEQSTLFIGRHPGYKDDGLLLHDENQINSEPDEIAQPKSRLKW